MPGILKLSWETAVWGFLQRHAGWKWQST